MNVGQLRRRITIQKPTQVADDMGGFTDTWTDYKTIWAKAWTVSSSERMEDMRVNLVRIQKFGIRYRTIDPSWRIKYDDRYFNIVSIDPDERHRFIYLTVEDSV